MLPSVVTSIPIVECSPITLLVPSSAASAKGIATSLQGVMIILSTPSSSEPSAPFTIYPTQSIIFTLSSVSPTLIFTDSSGTNFGSVVITVLPVALCGISSTVLCLSYSSSIFGSTILSRNLCINVDFPVLTGPTTPMYMSPPVLFAISL